MRISDWSSDVCSSDLARRIAGAGVDAGALAVHPAVTGHLAERLAVHNAGAGGQSRRVAALRLLADAPAGDEIADKGYINQREVQSRRVADVEPLYRCEAIFPARPSIPAQLYSIHTRTRSPNPK